MAKANTIVNLHFVLAGIPCLIGVESYSGQKPFKGSAHNCNSDWDYYGFEDIEYTILDRKGYKAEWLARKITPRIEEEINRKISDYFSD